MDQPQVKSVRKFGRCYYVDTQNIKRTIIEEFIRAGNSLKKQQIKVLIQNNFELLAQEYQSIVKRKIKKPLWRYYI